MGCSGFMIFCNDQPARQGVSTLWTEHAGAPLGCQNPGDKRHWQQTLDSSLIGIVTVLIRIGLTFLELSKNIMRIRPASIILASVLTAIIALLSPISGQVPSIAPPTVVPPTGAPETGAKAPQMPERGAHALTKEDVEAWLDGFMPYAIQRGDIAGAVVVVVKDGQILLPKGYGFADVAARKPIDPERTLFRAGSVSKLFTWTAVMQLVEQGKIDLDADVNGYTDLKVPALDGKPITMRNLMTHTPGFDETARGLIFPDAKQLPALGDVLKRWIPPRVTVAGSTPAYSNYGAALAGYIVERVSGQPFDDYIEQKIFAPLNMQHATFRQPLPERLQADMSNGYKVGSGEPQRFEIVNVPPAGSLSVSGADMGRFMIAHLQNGAGGSGRILQEATAIKMHTTANTMIPPLNRMLLGFYESNIDGRRVISHAGDLEWFHTDLNLLPDDGTGIFISMNSAGKEGAAHPIRTMLFQQFMERYFPGPLPEGKVDANSAKAHAQLMAGRYNLSRGSRTNFLALLSLFGQIHVTASADGAITIPALKGGNEQPKKWLEIA
ncbi:MAG: serine hydrolase domain-containing protein, partial [Chthoniobacterales bacterium]